MQQNLIDIFIDKFAATSKTNIRCFFAPGRVNLIGEHLDYNGGNVFPCCLDIGTYAATSPRQDRKFRLYSENFSVSGIIEFSLDNICSQTAHSWVNYPKGVIKTFLDNNYPIIHGLDICFCGDIPNGAGLSSSASIEVLTGIILKSYFNLANLTLLDIARLGQYAENNFIGVNCGIMDQFASAMGRQNNAMLLNCSTLRYKYVQLNITGYKLVIGNTRKKRILADSIYNQRVSQCRTALAQLQAKLDIINLCDINEEILVQNKNLITDLVNYKRAYHVISENERTSQAFTALENNDLFYFGELLKQSHLSLRDYYEVTGKELDTMVYAAWGHEACIGSRMTGAGLGGCTINLVKEESVIDFIQYVTDVYSKCINIEPEFYIVNVASGAKEIS